MLDNTGSKLTTWKENFPKKDTYELQMLINCESHCVSTLEFFKVFGKP